MRIFIGLDVPDSWRAALMAGAQAVIASDPQWAGEKWVPVENLHITLKFMGDIPDDSAEFLGPDLQEAVAGFGEFELPLHRALLPTPEARRATMLWTTLRDPDGKAAELLSIIEDVAANYGVVPESRHFSPHITLVRTRAPRELRNAQEISAVMEAVLPDHAVMSVPTVTVFRSTLTKSKPLYERLAVISLA